MKMLFWGFEERRVHPLIQALPELAQQLTSCYLPRTRQHTLANGHMSLSWHDLSEENTLFREEEIKEDPFQQEFILSLSPPDVDPEDLSETCQIFWGFAYIQEQNRFDLAILNRFHLDEWEEVFCRELIYLLAARLQCDYALLIPWASSMINTNWLQFQQGRLYLNTQEFWFLSGDIQFILVADKPDVPVPEGLPLFKHSENQSGFRVFYTPNIREIESQVAKKYPPESRSCFREGMRYPLEIPLPYLPETGLPQNLADQNPYKAAFLKSLAQYLNGEISEETFWDQAIDAYYAILSLTAYENDLNFLASIMVLYESKPKPDRQTLLQYYADYLNGHTFPKP